MDSVNRPAGMSKTAPSSGAGLTLLAALVVAGLAGVGASAEPLPVGSAKQLFIDGRFIESSKGIQLVVDRPRKGGERLIVVDKPWETGWIGGYLSVIQEGDRVNMWYEASALEGKEYEVALAYAHSTDGGRTWIKPSLGIIDFHGSKNNNLVPRDPAGIHFFLNRPGAPAGER